MMVSRSQVAMDVETEKVSLSEIISALSFALDLTEGAVQGHALRSCLMGMRLAHEIGLPDALCRELYYALLLKDVGCSSNAARMCVIVGGDDRAVKAGAKLEDWTKPHRVGMRTLRMLWKNVLPDSSAPERILRLAKMGLTQHRNNEEMITLRCDRGAALVRKLDMGELAANAIFHLDEHWDGSGYPHRLRGPQIPILSRICLLAQNLDAFATEDGIEASLDVARRRLGTWFDPELVRAAFSLHVRRELWVHCGPYDHRNETRHAVLDLDPAPIHRLGPEKVDTICESFAEVVDFKSPFTYRHSVGVTDIAERLAQTMGMSLSQQHDVRRAALLHDLGKLSVPNSILDKKSRLTNTEWEVILGHPTLTRSILERVRAFRDIALIAGQHHEKLDGSGYPLGLQSHELRMESRLITIADIYGAMAEERPYRSGMDPEEILRLLQQQVPGKLDLECFEALCTVVRSS